jgi:hypothetical protein
MSFILTRTGGVSAALLIRGKEGDSVALLIRGKEGDSTALLIRGMEGDSTALLIRGMPPPLELTPLSIKGGRGEGGEMFLDDELSISERDMGNNHPS